MRVLVAIAYYFAEGGSRIVWLVREEKKRKRAESRTLARACIDVASVESGAARVRAKRDASAYSHARDGGIH